MIKRKNVIDKAEKEIPKVNYNANAGIVNNYDNNNDDEINED